MCSVTTVFRIQIAPRVKEVNDSLHAPRGQPVSQLDTVTQKEVRTSGSCIYLESFIGPGTLCVRFVLSFQILGFAILKSATSAPRKNP